MVAAVTLVVIAGALLRGGSSDYQVRALVENAGQLVKGNLVKVGGVTVGSVSSIDLTSDNQAQITLKISDPRFKPLHEGTIATIRNTSLSSVAGRQIALQPGPNSNPKIGDDGAIKAEDTRAIVDLDQLLNTLDAQARTSLQELVHGGAVAFGSHPKQADAALAALNPALSPRRAARPRSSTATRRPSSASSSSRPAWCRASPRAPATSSGRRRRRAGGRRGRERVAVARQRPATARPRRCAGQHHARRAAQRADRPAAGAARAPPVAPRLANVLGPRTAGRTQRPAGGERPAALLPDVKSALRDLPELRERRPRPAFASDDQRAQGRDPVVQAARPYVPDLVGRAAQRLRRHHGGYYDANGHYARIGCEGSTYSLTNGGTLLPTPPAGARSTGYRNESPPLPGRRHPAAPPTSPTRGCRQASLRPEGQPVKRVAAIAHRRSPPWRSALALRGAGGGQAATTASTRSSTTPPFLIPGQDVKIAGAKVGSVVDVKLTAEHKARIQMEVGRQFAPFRSDADCTIQPQSLIGEKFIQCTPGTPQGAPLRAAAARRPTVPLAQHALAGRHRPRLRDVPRADQPAPRAPARRAGRGLRGARRRPQRRDPPRQPGAAADPPRARRS